MFINFGQPRSQGLWEAEKRDPGNEVELRLVFAIGDVTRFQTSVECLKTWPLVCSRFSRIRLAFKSFPVSSFRRLDERT